ncbi:MAG: LysE family transporter [bacterium]
MSLTTLFLSAFAVALSGALAPGPLLTLTIVRSLKKGFWQGPLIILGHAALETALIAVILLGGSFIFEIAAVKKIIFASGGIILVATALSLLKTNAVAGRLDPENYSSPVKDGGIPSVAAGVIGSLSNPYWLIWWITIGTGLLLQAVEFRIKGIVVFFSGHILADLLWYSLVSFSFSHGRKIINDKIYRLIIYACCFFLLTLAVWFFLKIPAL